MRQVYLTRLAYALGDEAESVAQADERASLTSSAAALREAGFAQHHVCRPGTTAYALARQSVENLGSPLERVDALIYACRLPKNGNIGNEAQFRATRHGELLMD